MRGGEVGVGLKMRDAVRAGMAENPLALVAGGPFDVAAGVAKHQNIPRTQVRTGHVAVEVADIAPARLHERIHSGGIGGIVAPAQEGSRCPTEVAGMLVPRDFNLHHLAVGTAVVERGGIRVSGFLGRHRFRPAQYRARSRGCHLNIW